MTSAVAANPNAWRKNDTEYVPPLDPAASIRSECMWCSAAWNGPTATVLAAHRDHRAVCPSRPPDIVTRAEKLAAKRVSSTAAEQARLAERQRAADEAEALLAAIDSHKAAGLTWEQITDAVNAEGHRNQEGSPWITKSLRSRYQRRQRKMRAAA